MFPFHILYFHNLELTFGSSCSKLQTSKTSNQIKILKNKQLSVNLFFEAIVRMQFLNGGNGQKKNKQTNDFTDLCWNQSVCISVVFCCNIFRGIFLIMEKYIGQFFGIA